VVAAIIHPDALHSFEGFDVSSVHTDVAILANEAEFQDVSECDVAGSVGISSFVFNE
jgi:hypothetical protein